MCLSRSLALADALDGWVMKDRIIAPERMNANSISETGCGTYQNRIMTHADLFRWVLKLV